ncbi:MAG: DUF4881 domain-containing protein [Deltaproteobacteria bacterium]|nr:DUF4881 domain-containing protein [Deltaproteobacteria bacterium]
MKKSYRIIALTLMPIMITLGCGELGKVDQGRVIQFDKAKGTATLIRDKNTDPQNPDYSYLPPITYTLPADPQEMGPDPKVGLRLKLDIPKKEIVIFDPATRTIKTLQYNLVDQKENITKEDPLVFDKDKDKPKPFPVIDREKKTITLYSKKQQTLITFSLPDEYLALPEYTWDSGDEVRIYYKEVGKARRFMNVTKTDIFKK